MLNLLVNNVLGSARVSFHQVVLMITFVSLSYTLITVDRVTLLLEPIAPFLASVGIVITFVVVCSVSYMCGEFTDATRKSGMAARKLVSRKSGLFKFFRSCPDSLHLEAAYPFFKIEKTTMPLFYSQGLDFLISALLL